MDKMISETKAIIKKQMNSESEYLYISNSIKKVVIEVIDHIDNTTGPVPLKGHNTQEKAQKFDDIIAGIILSQGVVEVIKLNKSEKDCLSFSHSDFDGNYFGYKKSNVSKRTILYLSKDIPEGLIMVRQPFGTQNNPDILLLDIIRDTTGKLIIHSYFGLEIKSGGTVWNTHIQHEKKNMLYIVYKTEKNTTMTNYFFGVDIRTKDEFIHALAVDHIHRELVNVANKQASSTGLRNQNVAYPKHEFKSNPFGIDNNKIKKGVREFLMI
jgi:hypothetical protein